MTPMAIPRLGQGEDAVSVHWLRHAYASHAIDNGAPITLLSATLGHADLKTTSVCARARPGGRARDATSRPNDGPCGATFASALSAMRIAK
jgi:integrase